MMVAIASINTPFGPSEEVLVAAMTDQGEQFPADIAAKLMDIPFGLPRLCETVPPDELEESLHWQYWDFLGSSDLESLAKLEEADADLERKISAIERECKEIVGMAWQAMNKLRHDRRQSDLTTMQRAGIADQLRRLETVPEEVGKLVNSRVSRLRRTHEQLEDAILASLQGHGEFAVLGTLRWKAQSGYAPSPLGDNEIRVGVPVPKNQLAFIRDEFARSLRNAFSRLEERVGSLINSIEYNDELDSDKIRHLKKVLAEMLT
ncbi:MAG: hypothetical protein LCH46_15985 [Proteobacteria bacterium]|nr:hypothetical protein [Pseudomonadota bacterium]